MTCSRLLAATSSSTQVDPAAHRRSVLHSADTRDPPRNSGPTPSPGSPAHPGGAACRGPVPLAERSAFTDDLRDAAIAVFERPGPKRGRVPGVSVRAEHLVEAAGARSSSASIPGREVSRLLDPVVERQCPLRPGAVTRGTLAHRRRTPAGPACTTSCHRMTACVASAPVLVASAPLREHRREPATTAWA